MIFLTVGTELPFDRLVRNLDDWSSRNPSVEVMGQIGRGAYHPRFIEAFSFLPSDQYAAAIDRCELIVAHAGMGTILSALRARKPVIVLPRRAKLGEHRNDHQIATAKAFAKQGLVATAFERASLWRQLDRRSQLTAPEPLGTEADPTLLEAIRAFVHDAIT